MKDNTLKLILEAIPRDEWVRANEIADKTGLTTHETHQRAQMIHL